MRCFAPVLVLVLAGVAHAAMDVRSSNQGQTQNDAEGPSDVQENTISRWWNELKCIWHHNNCKLVSVVGYSDAHCHRDTHVGKKHYVRRWHCKEFHDSFQAVKFLLPRSGVESDVSKLYAKCALYFYPNKSCAGAPIAFFDDYDETHCNETPQASSVWVNCGDTDDDFALHNGP